MQIKAPNYFIILILSLCGILCGCTTTLPDYEVLNVPQNSEEYMPGKVWLSGIGPSGSPLTQCATNYGLSKVNIDKQKSFQTALNVPLLKWISGALNIANQSDVHMAWTNLQTVYVLDAYKLATTDPVLWETIISSNFSMSLSNASTQDLQASVVASNLTAGISGNITISVTNSGSNGFAVSSDKPLVTAIKVVQPHYDVSIATNRIDLSSNSRGKTQSAGLGYFVNVGNNADSVDPLTQKAEVTINNPGMPQFAGTNVTFTETSPFWINNNSAAIARIDSKAKKSQFVWDKLSIDWDTNLSNCFLRVTRQYIAIKTVNSGLTTR